MPISPEDTRRVAARMVDVYASLSEALMAALVRELRVGDPDRVGWVEDRLANVTRLDGLLRRLLRDLDAGLDSTLDDIIATAVTLGVKAADRDLGPNTPPGLSNVEVTADRVALLAREELGAALRGTHVRAIRATRDTYRAVLTEVQYAQASGFVTRRQAAQQALDRFAAKGITGYVDAAGRAWELTSYVESATRAATARTAVNATTQRLTDAGRDLVIVSDSPRECERCRPFEGKVLSLTGRTPDREELAGGHRYAGTLDEATSRGLLHPGCTHSIAAFTPGVTRALRGDLADPEGDKAKQHLRYLERQTRASKRMEAAALDDTAAAKARARTRAYQAKIRAHVDATGAKRQPHREQLGVAR